MLPRSHFSSCSPSRVPAERARFKDRQRRPRRRRRRRRPRRRFSSPPTACAPTSSTVMPARASCRRCRPSCATASRGRTACSRASRPTPEWAGTRSPRAHGQASTVRRTTPSTAPVRATSTTRRASRPPASSRPTTSARRPSGRARAWSQWSGWALGISFRPSRARSSTSAASSPGGESSSTTTCPGSRPAPTHSASTTNGSTSLRPRAGATSRPRSAPRRSSSSR